MAKLFAMSVAAWHSASMMTADFIPATAQTALMAFPLLLIIAGAGDVMTLRIPNWLIVILASSFPAFAWAAGMSPFLFGLHIATSIALLLAGFVLFSLRLFGGGDAKLMAAAGLWLGFPCVIPFVLLTAVAGGLLAGVIGIMHAIHMEASLRDSWTARLLVHFRPDVPYGFAIAAGAILAVPYSFWAVAAAG